MKRISCISIIDDDQLFQYSIKKVLQSTDIIDNILQFRDGEAALNYLLKNKDNAAMLPEIIFLDLHMPLMDGWEFLEEFTSNTAVAKKTTIYICTSSIDHTNQERFKSYNKLSGYIIKPIRKNEIYELLDNELNSSYAAISPNIVLG
ncbi:response regulator [Pedobacter sp. SYSU D00535]|uniref:response regulator n=1 Tax=Pedobacter sp. SYSU D00535 TaxID=2810308 RepID=UPI001A968A30|nr:response regulator [Pedobacter sp. SYSU D00535]